jgi:hypothetical protein
MAGPGLSDAARVYDEFVPYTAHERDMAMPDQQYVGTDLF